MSFHPSRLGIALAALVACACGSESEMDSAEAAQGGQTGSASCDNPPDCVCDMVRNASVLRGRVSQAASGDVRVEVTRVFASDDPNITPGATIGGSFIVGELCGVGTLDPPALDLDVFIAYQPGAAVCFAYENCAATCTSTSPDDSENDECQAQCRTMHASECEDLAENPLLHGMLLLVPWQDPLPLSDDVSLASDELELLSDDAACRARFASEEPVTCNGF
jgi:hypothetical protein